MNKVYKLSSNSNVSSFTLETLQKSQNKNSIFQALSMDHTKL